MCTLGLGSYANNLVDYHIILDLLPMVAKCYFLGKFRTVARKVEEDSEKGKERTIWTPAMVTNNGAFFLPSFCWCFI